MTAQKKLPRISGAFVITNFKFSLFSSGCFRFRFENALYCPTGRYDNRVLEHAAGTHFLELFAAYATSGGDSVNRNEYQEVSLLASFALGLEYSSYPRNVAENGNAVVNRDNFFACQTAHYECRAVEYRYLSFYFAYREYRLNEARGNRYSSRVCDSNRNAAVFKESFKFRHAGIENKVDRTVFFNVSRNFHNNTDVVSGKVCRSTGVIVTEPLLPALSPLEVPTLDCISPQLSG